MSIFREAPKQALLIAVPCIGDALLATPIARALKTSFPECAVDMLVPEGREGIVHGNPDLRDVLTFIAGSKLRGNLPLLRRIFRRYDVAVSTSTSDRYFAYLFAASGLRVSLVPKFAVTSAWKYLATRARSELDKTTHTVSLNLRLLDEMGLERCYEVVPPGDGPPRTDADWRELETWCSEPFAVIHQVPGWPYKLWPSAHWHRVIEHLISCGLRVALTGGPGERERQLVESTAAQFPQHAKYLAGRLNFREVSWLLRRAKLYLGTDTSTTHLAAAVGIPTVAIFGPTSPLVWGPWPKGWREPQDPFQEAPGTQYAGNVVLFRGLCDCGVKKTTCLRPDGEFSGCTARVDPQQVIGAVEAILNRQTASPSPR